MATDVNHPLEVAAREAAQRIPDSMEVVTKAEFFKHIGPRNVHPALDGKYAANWLEVNSRRRVGRSLPGYVNPSDAKVYMLNKGQG